MSNSNKQQNLPAWAAKHLVRFEHWIRKKSASEAMREYRMILEAAIAEARDGYLEGQELACRPHCNACCHQMLAVQLVELCDIFFAQEARFSKKGFKKKLAREIKQLRRWKKMGAVLALDFTKRQWQAKWPCVLLGKDGLCTAYGSRPMMCRNLFSLTTCTFDNYAGIGSEVIGHLGRHLRRVTFRHLGLERFSKPKLDLETYQFLLPQGIQWMLEEAPLDELREVFRA